MAGEVVLVPARAEHAFVLATTLRPNDVRELAACGQGPLDGLLFALKGSSVAYAALHDDVVGAMFGVRSMVAPALGAPVRGELWFLTGHLFGQKPIAFTRAARRVVDALLTQYDELVNHIDSRYTEALRFAVSMGAQLGGETPVGPERVPFIKFSIRG